MAVKRLIDLPEEFDVAPDWVFDRLREIDPDLEVLCVSPGFWWVGCVKPNAPRCATGRKALEVYEKGGMLKTNEADWPIIRNAIIKSQGFGLIGKYRFKGGNEDWGGIIEEIRYADWMWRTYEGMDEPTREAFEGVSAKSMRAKVAARITQAMDNDRRYLFKKLKGGVSVPVGAN